MLISNNAQQTAYNRSKTTNKSKKKMSKTIKGK